MVNKSVCAGFLDFNTGATARAARRRPRAAVDKPDRGAYLSARPLSPFSALLPSSSPDLPGDLRKEFGAGAWTRGEKGLSAAARRAAGRGDPADRRGVGKVGYARLDFEKAVRLGE
jgi:hypothetical protein